LWINDLNSPKRETHLRFTFLFCQSVKRPQILSPITHLSKLFRSFEGRLLKTIHLAKETQQKSGDNVFEEELLPHITALKTFAFHLCYNDEDANDLVQETYMKAYRFIDKYQSGTNAKAWLFKILKNAYINEYRKKSSRPRQVDFEESISFQAESGAAVGQFFDLRTVIFDQAMGDEISLALDNLPEDFRSVILLCDVEQFSYEEISNILEIPIGTVRSRLFRARNMLKEKLKAYASSLGYKDKREERRKRNLTQAQQEEE
ncbi:UNVERIFIED_CONTAM: hypothetical protein GTU68_052819, partial [Idotea baltica]|nr:hypothetical protein [Idotea baltica]